MTHAAKISLYQYSKECVMTIANLPASHSGIQAAGVRLNTAIYSHIVYIVVVINEYLLNSVHWWLW